MAKKKAKAAAKKKAKAAPKKKAKKSASKKVRAIAAKLRPPVKAKPKAAARKRGLSKAEVKADVSAKSNEKKASGKKQAPDAAEDFNRSEEQNLIPTPGQEHPVRAEEAEQIERVFHNKEEVAFRQENQKIKESLPRKGPKSYHNRGMR